MEKIFKSIPSSEYLHKIHNYLSRNRNPKFCRYSTFVYLNSNVPPDMKIFTILPIKYQLLLANVSAQSSARFTNPGTGNMAKISNKGIYIRGIIYHAPGFNLPILSGRISPFRIEAGILPADRKAILIN